MIASIEHKGLTLLMIGVGAGTLINEEPWSAFLFIAMGILIELFTKEKQYRKRK